MPLTKEQLLIPRVHEYKVYVLIDPIDNLIKYVGCTRNDLKRRLSLHCNSNVLDKKKNPEKYEWAMRLVSVGLRPIIVPLFTFNSKKEAFTQEHILTESLKKLGVKLFNKYSGSRISESAKTKASNRLKGKPLPISMTIAASQKRKKSVVQLSADGSFIKKWDFISDAAKALNIDRGDITKRCKDGNKAKGFRWMYETEYLKQKEG